jgi:uncharacterized membrane protein
MITSLFVVIIIVILSCFVLCTSLFFRTCSLYNWPSGCWVGTQIYKNWIVIIIIIIITVERRLSELINNKGGWDNRKYG